MGSLFYLYRFYKYIAVCILILLCSIAIFTEHLLIKNIVDNTLDEQYEDIQKAIGKYYITTGDTLWGSNWFAVPFSSSDRVDVKKNVKMEIDGETKHFRHIEKSFQINKNRVVIQTWIEIDIASYYTLLYIVFPVIVFLLFLGYIALIEYIHYRSWELLNGVSSVFETFSVSRDSYFRVDLEQKSQIKSLDGIIAFILSQKRLRKGKSFRDMNRIFSYMQNKVELAEQNDIHVDNDIILLQKTIKTAFT